MIDLADPAAVAAYGRDASDAALLDDITQAIHALFPDDFVRSMDQLERAVSTADAKRTKRQVGWFGRMLGVDIQAQAEGEALRARMGVLLGDARHAAEQVQAALARLVALEARLDVVIARIDGEVEAGHALLEREPGPDPDPRSPTERFRRRLVHLSTVAASHRTTRETLRHARTEAAGILERHANLQALIEPVWAQHRLATRKP